MWFIKSSLILSAIFMFIIFALNKYSKKMISKMSPFECGFYPLWEGMNPISTQFFLIALVFLIFDIEVVLLFPFLVFKSSKSFFLLGLFLLILLIILGTIVEWNQGVLEWLK